MASSLYPDLTPFYRQGNEDSSFHSAAKDKVVKSRDTTTTTAKSALLQGIRNRLAGMKKNNNRPKNDMKQHERHDLSSTDKSYGRQDLSVPIYSHYPVVTPTAPPQEIFFENDHSTHITASGRQKDGLLTVSISHAMDEPTADYTLDLSFVSINDIPFPVRGNSLGLNLDETQDQNVSLSLNTTQNNLNLSHGVEKRRPSKQVWPTTDSHTSKELMTSLRHSIPIDERQQRTMPHAYNDGHSNTASEEDNTPAGQSRQMTGNTALNIPIHPTTRPTSSSQENHNFPTTSYKKLDLTKQILSTPNSRNPQPDSEQTLIYQSKTSHQSAHTHVPKKDDNIPHSSDNTPETYPHMPTPSGISGKSGDYKSWLAWRKEMNRHLSGVILLRPDRSLEYQHLQEVSKIQPSQSSMERMFHKAKHDEKTALREKTYIMYGIPRVKV